MAAGEDLLYMYSYAAALGYLLLVQGPVGPRVCRPVSVTRESGGWLGDASGRFLHKGVVKFPTLPYFCIPN
jgi:hypothetical protein